MSRLSLSDIVEAQAAQVETLLGMVRDVLAELSASRKANAAESVTVKRVGTGEKVTAAEVVVVVQPGETLKQAAARGAEVYEALAARYPLPNGAAHLAALGDGLDEWRQTLENGAGLHAVPDPEPSK